MTGLAWSSIGEGVPLVIVHGYTGSNADFAHLAPDLADMCRVVLVDQLGHGRSPRITTYTYDALTDAIVDFIRQEMGSPVHLLGHSLGGRVVLPIAIRHPELVLSLVLMDTWADTPERDPYAAEFAAAFSLPPQDQLAALDRIMEKRPDPERPLIDAVHGDEWETARRGFNESLVDPEAVRQLGRYVFVDGADVLVEATAVKCPTTIVVGEFDEPFLDPSVRLAAAIAGSRLVRIGGAYHSPQLSHPAEWLRAVSDHLAWAMGS